MAQSSKTGRTLLIVDDNPAIHDVFRQILDPPQLNSKALDELAASLFGEDVAPEPEPERRPFELAFALQGQEALRKVVSARDAGTPYALVFMDVLMPPGWDGVETTIKVLEVDPDVHVVLCTAYAETGWQKPLEHHPHRDRVLILKKPFDAVEVRQLANALCDKREFADRDKARMLDLERSIDQRQGELDVANENLRREIAERSLVEGRLEKAQRLEGLGKLAAGLCHEINNPLSFIVGSLEMLRENTPTFSEHLPPPVYEEFAELMDAIGNGADRITHIVRSMQLFARESEVPNQRLETTTVIESAVRMSRPVLLSHIEFRVDARDAPPILGRPVEFEQVLINLIENAGHAMANQHDRPSIIEVGAAPGAEGWVCIRVADTGPGMAPAVLRRIFDPFFTTKDVGRGTGLGLSICHSLVTNMNGTLDVESEPGRWTTFTVRLPIAGPEADAPAASEAREEEPKTARSGRVLVVDDEPVVIDLITRILVQHEVDGAPNGQEGLARYEQAPYDVILCDLVMPGTDGMDFYRALAERSPGAERRVVFITGGTLIEQFETFLQGVPNACLDKPFDTAELRAVVAARLEPEASASER